MNEIQTIVTDVRGVRLSASLSVARLNSAARAAHSLQCLPNYVDLWSVIIVCTCKFVNPDLGLSYNNSMNGVRIIIKISSYYKESNVGLPVCYRE